MKMVDLRLDHADIEHEGKIYRLGGEFKGEFIARKSLIEQLISKDQTAPLTEEEQDQVMSNVEKYWNEYIYLICFVDDEDNLICASRIMIIEIGKGYIDFLYKRKIVRAWGKKRFDIYRLKAERIEWADSDSAHRLNEEERTAFIKEAMKFCHRSLYMTNVIEIVFVDKKGKKIEMPDSQ